MYTNQELLLPGYTLYQGESPNPNYMYLRHPNAVPPPNTGARIYTNDCVRIGLFIDFNTIIGWKAPSRLLGGAICNSDIYRENPDFYQLEKEGEYPYFKMLHMRNEIYKSLQKTNVDSELLVLVLALLSEPPWY
jgi:hypothetical protein